MIIVALDLASQTGVAVGEPASKPILFTEKLGLSGCHHGERMAEAMRMMNRIIKQYEPSLIVLEAPLKLPGTRADIEQVLMGLRGCVMGVAHMHHIQFEQHAVQTIRKHFIGHGRLKRKAAKAATIARCKQLGWNPRNDDEADAAALWDLACSHTSRAHSLAGTPLFGGGNG
jgi:Holliday junction resolvasome RuvABC endonuclease subunit